MLCEVEYCVGINHVGINEPVLNTASERVDYKADTLCVVKASGIVYPRAWYRRMLYPAGCSLHACRPGPACDRSCTTLHLSCTGQGQGTDNIMHAWRHEIMDKHMHAYTVNPCLHAWVTAHMTCAVNITFPGIIHSKHVNHATVVQPNTSGYDDS